MLGTSFYSGDLNERKHFNPNLMHRAIGVVFRRNLNPRWTMRYFALYGKVSGDDALYDTPLANSRQLSFRSNIYEGSAQFELNFFDYIASDNRRYFTPTVFAGLGMFWMNPQGRIGDTDEYRALRLQRNEGQQKEYSRLQPCLPFGVGLRLKFSSRFLMTAEYSIRKTWTDYLDDVSTVYPGRVGNQAQGLQSPGYQRGNSESNDWYIVAGMNITYRFGHKPNVCYFDKVNRRAKKRRQSQSRSKRTIGSDVAN